MVIIRFFTPSFYIAGLYGISITRSSMALKNDLPGFHILVPGTGNPQLRDEVRQKWWDLKKILPGDN